VLRRGDRTRSGGYGVVVGVGSDTPSPPSAPPGMSPPRFAVVVVVRGGAVVVDVAWYWTVSQRMQSAADAAALAGVIWLPGDPTTAYSTARAEAKKNGFENGVGGVVVTPNQDLLNKRRLKVTITGPVGTFFSRVVGLNSFPGAREAKADYALPVLRRWRPELADRAPQDRGRDRTRVASPTARPGPPDARRPCWHPCGRRPGTYPHSVRS